MAIAPFTKISVFAELMRPVSVEPQRMVARSSACRHRLTYRPTDGRTVRHTERTQPDEQTSKQSRRRTHAHAHARTTSHRQTANNADRHGKPSNQLAEQRRDGVATSSCVVSVALTRSFRFCVVSLLQARAAQSRLSLPARRD
eukprot:6207635-Pleurochrysis_carterae.AAC.1